MCIISICTAILLSFLNLQIYMFYEIYTSYIMSQISYAPYHAYVVLWVINDTFINIYYICMYKCVCAYVIYHVPSIVYDTCAYIYI